MSKEKRNIVFFTGSGISKESGLQTFRDCVDGLWYEHKIEDVATIEAWESNPSMLLNFYSKRREEVFLAEPNLAHNMIADLESGGRFNVNVITQNVDNLHERAGSKNVLHLHGRIDEVLLNVPPIVYNEVYSITDLSDELSKTCRPNVVLFGENIHDYDEAVDIIREADYLVIVGTSLQVSPACHLIEESRSGCKIYNINPVIEERFRQSESIEKVATEGIKELLDVL